MRSLEYCATPFGIIRSAFRASERDARAINYKESAESFCFLFGSVVVKCLSLNIKTKELLQIKKIKKTINKSNKKRKDEFYIRDINVNKI